MGLGSASTAAPLLARSRREEEEKEKEKEQVVERKGPWRGWGLGETWRELKLVWRIAGPAILTSLFEYSLGSVTQTLVGHIGTLELAAVGLQNLVISGIGFGIMLGMGSALETLSGQAYGAGKPHMLGIYLQRSWIILLLTGLVLSTVCIFATPILKLLGQTDEIAELAGRFSIWMIPELFAFAVDFPIEKFLQAQSKVGVMAGISATVLAVHLPLSWVFIIKLNMGLVGAAITLNLAWFLLVAGQLAYLFSGKCRDAWTGFSWLALTDLVDFLWLSVASAVMLCLEYWTMMVVILLAGLLKDPEIAVDAASICMNMEGWSFMIPLGFVAAVSVRVSNELGAGRPKAAKFSVLVVIMISVAIQTTVMLIILTTREHFPALFTEDQHVMAKVSKLAFFLAASIFLSSIQPVLSGVAIGASWQSTVAYINLGCYYVVGLGTGALLGFKLNLGLETIILVVITWRTDWDKEAQLARDRVATWVG
ncbi:protein DETOXIFICATION 33-like isoform X1 [Ananas comosus]|uniref:Protein DETOXIFICATION n=1 Tax=Ananas comosus TaxID=4615 RepID=A0A6P5FBI4_ANACO|nr:protein DETOXIFICATION 33-like isoform X1 [Ananas comosus]